LFHGIARPAVVVAVSMNGSSVERKELHVDPAQRAVVDPERPVVPQKSGRSWASLNGPSGERS
jgi:hypothetical protein